MEPTRVSLLLRLSTVLGIAVLAALSIRFSRTRHEHDDRSEVTVTLTRLAVTEELHKEQTGSYAALPPMSERWCSYTVVAGAKTDPLTPPAGFKSSTGGTGAESGIASSWWYMLASCDDAKSYYASSVDPTLQVQRSRR